MSLDFLFIWALTEPNFFKYTALFLSLFFILALSYLFEILISTIIWSIIFGVYPFLLLSVYNLSILKEICYSLFFIGINITHIIFYKWYTGIIVWFDIATASLCILEYFSNSKVSSFNNFIFIYIFVHILTKLGWSLFIVYKKMHSLEFSRSSESSSLV